MTTCIHYSRPKSGEGDEVFGLDVAVNNFLSAYFRYSTQDKFICRPTDIPSFDYFKSLIESSGHKVDQKCVGIDPRFPRLNMSTIDCLFRPDPLTSDLVWQRQQINGPGYATCGLVHTMSGERIASAVGQLALAPSRMSDALICPSEAIRDAVHNLWNIQAEYLNHRTGGLFKTTISTPIIPLGVDALKFERLTTPEKRISQRQSLHAEPEEIVLLFHGRLSFATKSHPLALFLALERAAKSTRRKLRLIMYGYFKPKDMERRFHDLARDMVHHAAVEFVANDDRRFPDGLWAAADIFVSLSDNIQESFGLTPIEALASGLPALVTDWDGYRGSVRHGIDGLLIPTLAPPISSGLTIAENYFNEQNYGVSLMGAAQSTAVNVERCAESIRALADDDCMRATMAHNGRERARNVFDWKHIIKAYEDLWNELGEKHKETPTQKSLPDNWQAAHPNYPNPFAMFKSFPSSTLELDHVLKVVMTGDDIALLLLHDMNYFIPELLIPKASMLDLIEVIRRAGVAKVGDILAPFPLKEHDRLLRCLGWMLKHAICIVVGHPHE